MENCKGCRFWSQMIAKTIVSDHFYCIEAVCLAAVGPNKGKWVLENKSCSSWKSNHFGSVDEPPDYGETARAAYAEEERQALLNTADPDTGNLKHG